jgi:hypothetical protein
MRPTQLVLLALSLTAATGCDSANAPIFAPPASATRAPAPPVSLAVSGPAAVAGRAGSYESGAPRVECQVTLTAEVTASQTAASQATASHASVSARWAGASARWYRLSTGALAQSKELSAAEVGQLWGATQVSAGDQQWSQLTFWEAEPFRLSIDFRYTTPSAGSPKTVSYWLRCEAPTS